MTQGAEAFGHVDLAGAMQDSIGAVRWAVRPPARPSRLAAELHTFAEGCLRG